MDSTAFKNPPHLRDELEWRGRENLMKLLSSRRQFSVFGRGAMRARPFEISQRKCELPGRASTTHSATSARYVKAYLTRSKNDANDAAAICEAVTRPSMRFVPIKSEQRLNPTLRVLPLRRVADFAGQDDCAATPPWPRPMLRCKKPAVTMHGVSTSPDCH